MSTPFSRKLPASYRGNPLLEQLERRRHSPLGLLDLTASNPTQVGLPYPDDRIRAAYEGGDFLTYTASAQGLPSAREAIGRYYADRTLAINPDHLFLTASTSDSYHLLFKLLADPGEGILVPEPSYPLFDTLLSLESLTKIPYSLTYESGHWAISEAALESAIAQSQTPPKALIVVNPNNPTGSFLSESDWDVCRRLCKKHRLALISDEVFWDYPLSPVARYSAVTAAADSASFTLNGISKLCGLPQLKLGWIHVGGPAAWRAQAVAHLEFIADCYLSVSTPIQHALSDLLALPLHTAIGERVAGNLALLQTRLANHATLQLMPVDGGWSACIRLPAALPDDQFCAELLDETGVWVYPGYFFDFPQGDWIVVSLLVEPEVLAHGIRRLLAFTQTRQH